MKDKSVGSDIRIDEKIIRTENINIKTKKKKVENKISKNNFLIKKEEKKIKDAETQIFTEENIVEKMDDFNIHNNDYIRCKRIKDK